MYSFRSSIFRYSPKKLITIAKHIQFLSLDQAIAFVSCLNKGCATDIYKSLRCIKDNIDKNSALSSIGVSSNALVIAAVSVEKKMRGHHIRYHARSRFSRSSFNFCRLKFMLDQIKVK